MKFSIERLRCTRIDNEGYCELRPLLISITELKTKEAVMAIGRRVYCINVFEHRWFYALYFFCRAKG